MSYYDTYKEMYEMIKQGNTHYINGNFTYLNKQFKSNFNKLERILVETEYTHNLKFTYDLYVGLMNTPVYIEWNKH